MDEERAELLFLDRFLAAFLASAGPEAFLFMVMIELSSSQKKCKDRYGLNKQRKEGAFEEWVG